ncbi:lysine--tRNA ligase [Abditibacteriota bacterium]|nr:lysine--tRNA ligase [Abditibacteriota bacterium]
MLQYNTASRVEMTSYGEVLHRFADRHTVTIAAGTTCAYLGDERNLREFMVADEMARVLRRAGHIVSFLLIDDSLDPLNIRQLRVAVNKDQTLIDKFAPWCGKPISQIPDPYNCHESFAEHFEEELLKRLHRLGANPTLVSTSKLYERGRYAPFVRIVLEQHDEILAFLSQKFPTYNPDKLFWPLCPRCRFLDGTRVTGTHNDCVQFSCDRCNSTEEIPFDEVEGKLNWKLDCAVRWVLLGVDIEPFSKSYLEPTAGSFFVAQAIAQRFFDWGERTVTPFQYGAVGMERQWSMKLLDALPSDMLRSMMVNRPATDFQISRDQIVSLASRHTVETDLNYLDFVRQILPMWLLTPENLSARQRDLVAHGVAFADSFLDSPTRLHLPTRNEIEGERPEVLRGVHAILARTIALRTEEGKDTREEFEPLIQDAMKVLGSLKGPCLHRLRTVVGQQQGLPAARFLFSLPLGYLRTVEFLLELTLQQAHPTFSQPQSPARRAA